MKGFIVWLTVPYDNFHVVTEIFLFSLLNFILFGGAPPLQGQKADTKGQGNECDGYAWYKRYKNKLKTKFEKKKEMCF